MRKYDTVSENTDKLSEIVCNMCAAHIKKNDFGYFADNLRVEKRWGYGSDMDGETHEFDLCEDCYKKLISSFKIKVKK